MHVRWNGHWTHALILLHLHIVWMLCAIRRESLWWKIALGRLILDYVRRTVR